MERLEQLFDLDWPARTGEEQDRSGYLAEAIAVMKAAKVEKAEFRCDAERTEIRGYFQQANFGADIFSEPELLLGMRPAPRPSLVHVVLRSLGLRPEAVLIEKRNGISMAKLEIDLWSRQFKVLNGRCARVGVQLAVTVKGGLRALDEEIDLFSRAGLAAR